MENKKNYQRASWRFGLFLFIALFLMWPMLKGTYYKKREEKTPEPDRKHSATLLERKKRGHSSPR